MRSVRRITLPVTAAFAATALVALPARAQYLAPRAEVETFVAPTDGGPLHLTGISINTFNFFAPTSAAIYAWDGSNLTGPSLYQTVLAPRFVPGISLTPDLPVTPGTTYAFALFLSPTVSSSFTLVPGGLVQGGQAYRCFESTGCETFAALVGDPPGQARHFAGFAATFSPAPVVTPEPASLALTATGVIVLGAAARRRRAVARRGAP